MKKVMSLVMALVIATGCLCVFGASAEEIETWYVKTGNGKTLNVRDVYSGEVIGRLNYGTPVGVSQFIGDWAIIVYGSYGDAKVMKKFLVKNDPGKYVGPQDEDGTVLKDSDLGSETVDGLNKQYKIMVYVDEPYSVVAVPTTRTGTVNLRWGPSKNTNLVAMVPADYELTVLAESKNWLLVSDPLTGKISYVARKYTNAD